MKEDRKQTAQTVSYWRNPTQQEINFGDGAIHYISIDVARVLKPNGQLKKWFVNTDGLRYNR